MMFLSKIKFLFALPVMLAVSACGSVMTKDQQVVTIETPGSSSSRCILENGNRYKAVSGVPITIMRSSRDLKVECYGSNNRQETVVVESKLNVWSAGNVVTGVLPGVAYDHLSGGLYQYPDVITVAFSNMTNKGFELPQYHDVDMPNPYETPIEGYSASTAKLPQDNGFLKRGVERRNDDADMNPFDGFYGANAPAPAQPMANIPPMTPSAASPNAVPVPRGKTAEDLNRLMNPSVFGQ